MDIKKIKLKNKTLTCNITIQQQANYKTFQKETTLRLFQVFLFSSPIKHVEVSMWLLVVGCFYTTCILLRVMSMS
jgi:hypothetical protein